MQDFGEFLRPLNHCIVLCIDMVGMPTAQASEALKFRLERRRIIAITNDVVAFLNRFLPSSERHTIAEASNRMWRTHFRQPILEGGYIRPGVEQIRFDQETAVCRLSLELGQAVGV